MWSGRRDSNSRPLGPKPSALTRLRYAPKLLKSMKAFLSSAPKYTECFAFRQAHKDIFHKNPLKSLNQETRVG